MAVAAVMGKLVSLDFPVIQGKYRDELPLYLWTLSFLNLRQGDYNRCCPYKGGLVSVCRSNVAVYGAETCCHSTSATSRLPLKSSREIRCLS